jgi:hypothetical protein
MKSNNTRQDTWKIHSPGQSNDRWRYKAVDADVANIGNAGRSGYKWLLQTPERYASRLSGVTKESRE